MHISELAALLQQPVQAAVATAWAEHGQGGRDAGAAIANVVARAVAAAVQEAP